MSKPRWSNNLQSHKKKLHKIVFNLCTDQIISDILIILFIKREADHNKFADVTVVA